MIKISIDESLLLEAFKDRAKNSRYLLDKKTSNIFCFTDNMPPSEKNLLLSQMDINNPNRYLPIPKVKAKDTFTDMEDFIKNLQNVALKKKLTQALTQEGGVFKAFRDILINHPEEEEKWHRFQKEKDKKRLREWLLDMEIQLI